MPAANQHPAMVQARAAHPSRALMQQKCRPWLRLPPWVVPVPLLQEWCVTHRPESQWIGEVGSWLISIQILRVSDVEFLVLLSHLLQAHECRPRCGGIQWPLFENSDAESSNHVARFHPCLCSAFRLPVCTSSIVKHSLIAACGSDWQHLLVKHHELVGKD